MNFIELPVNFDIQDLIEPYALLDTPKNLLLKGYDLANVYDLTVLRSAVNHPAAMDYFRYDRHFLPGNPIICKDNILYSIADLEDPSLHNTRQWVANLTAAVPKNSIHLKQFNNMSILSLWYPHHVLDEIRESPAVYMQDLVRTECAYDACYTGLSKRISFQEQESFVDYLYCNASNSKLRYKNSSERTESDKVLLFYWNRIFKTTYFHHQVNIPLQDGMYFLNAPSQRSKELNIAFPEIEKSLGIKRSYFKDFYKNDIIDSVIE